MPLEPHSLWIHKDLQQRLHNVYRSSRRRLYHKTVWAQLQLAMHGRTPQVKGTSIQPCRWRRTPVQGNAFYMWWVPGGISGARHLAPAGEARATFVRAVRPHSENSKRLEPGPLEDYQRVDIRQLDTLYDDQRQIAPVQYEPDGVQVRTVTGGPGSGKTVALHYAAQHIADSTDRRVWYITYTARLAEQARSFFEASGVSKHVQVQTLHELQAGLLTTPGEPSALLPSDAQVNKLEEMLSCWSPQQLGPWTKYIDMLWIEIRAFLLGMALPYPWKRHGYEKEVSAGELLSEDAYLHFRRETISEEAAEVAHVVANWLHQNQQDSLVALFPDQLCARRALDRLRGPDAETPSAIRQLKALVVDEIQDLTLVQIALLVELVRIAARQRQPVTFIAAGDESQTVWPSGFLWSVTKDLLCDQLAIGRAEPVQFRSQRRSPPRLAKLIEDSWGLYKRHVSEKHTPKQFGIADLDSQPDPSDPADRQLLRWTLTCNTPWTEVLQLATEHPNLAFVDLDDTATRHANELSVDAQDRAHAQIFAPGTIKGLERAVVIVTGLDHALREIKRCSAQIKDGYLVPHLHTRGTIDKIRVALSRATHTLVLAETENSVMASELCLSDIEPIDWPVLRKLIEDQVQDMDALEKINTLLYNAAGSISGGEHHRADALNQQAAEIAGDLNDEELNAQISQQRAEIDEGLARQAIGQIQELLEAGSLESADDQMDATRSLIDTIQLEAMQDQWNQAHSTIHLWKTIREALQKLQDDDGGIMGYIDFKDHIEPALSDAQNQHLQDEATKLRDALAPRHKKIAIVFWKQGQHHREKHRWLAAAPAFRRAAQALSDSGQDRQARALGLLADRYSELPPPVADHPARISELIQYIHSYRQLLEASQAIDRDEPRAFLSEWAVELIGAFVCHPHLYEEHGPLVARRLSGDPIHFLRNTSAFTDSVTAAFTKLREIGQWENALHLLQLLGKPPDALKQQIDVLRGLPNFIHKGQQITANLYPAERERLFESLQDQVNQVNLQPFSTEEA